MNRLGIVRWLPLVVAAAACSPDVVTAPGQIDESLLVTAEAGKKAGFDPSSAMEPNRLIQRAYWNAGFVKDFKIQTTQAATYRICQLNSLEDLDGNDFFSLHADGYIEEQVNEQDGFVLVMSGSSGWDVQSAAPNVWVGRSTWSATIWKQATPSGTQLVSINGIGQGVLAPLKVDGMAVSPEAAELLAALNGGWGPSPSGTYPAGFVYDVERSPLTPLARPTALVNQILGAADQAGALLGVRCDWQQNGDWVKNNQITFERTWPAHLNALFH